MSAPAAKEKKIMYVPKASSPPADAPQTQMRYVPKGDSLQDPEVASASYGGRKNENYNSHTVANDPCATLGPEGLRPGVYGKGDMPGGVRNNRRGDRERERGGKGPGRDKYDYDEGPQQPGGPVERVFDKLMMRDRERERSGERGMPMPRGGPDRDRDFPPTEYPQRGGNPRGGGDRYGGPGPGGDFNGPPYDYDRRRDPPPMMHDDYSPDGYGPPPGRFQGAPQGPRPRGPPFPGGPVEDLPGYPRMGPGGPPGPMGPGRGRGPLPDDADFMGGPPGPRGGRGGYGMGPGGLPGPGMGGGEWPERPPVRGRGRGPRDEDLPEWARDEDGPYGPPDGRPRSGGGPMGRPGAPGPYPPRGPPDGRWDEPDMGPMGGPRRPPAVPEWEMGAPPPPDFMRGGRGGGPGGMPMRGGPGVGMRGGRGGGPGMEWEGGHSPRAPGPGPFGPGMGGPGPDFDGPYGPSRGGGRGGGPRGPVYPPRGGGGGPMGPPRGGMGGGGPPMMRGGRGGMRPPMRDDRGEFGYEGRERRSGGMDRGAPPPLKDDTIFLQLMFHAIGSKAKRKQLSFGGIEGKPEGYEDGALTEKELLANKIFLGSPVEQEHAVCDIWPGFLNIGLMKINRVGSSLQPHAASVFNELVQTSLNEVTAFELGTHGLEKNGREWHTPIIASEQEEQACFFMRTINDFCDEFLRRLIWVERLETKEDTDVEFDDQMVPKFSLFRIDKREIISPHIKVSKYGESVIDGDMDFYEDLRGRVRVTEIRLTLAGEKHYVDDPRWTKTRINTRRILTDETGNSARYEFSEAIDVYPEASDDEQAHYDKEFSRKEAEFMEKQREKGPRGGIRGGGYRGVSSGGGDGAAPSEDKGSSVHGVSPKTTEGSPNERVPAERDGKSLHGDGEGDRAVTIGMSVSGEGGKENALGENEEAAS
uniref:Uncharacterized protein n=1 Tax=Chromera velia CCMP2878 TaxID=1169474 RepID=A0A0G4FWU2_9ALVE|eukprot:Cvel_19159.t1-p1 / transcript=Cvel_19159.t1 / gene=Cvel_19159 / organism=Chromera_velia_CCMP2878 / gene_product=hypothetical protein / transcript_product=hypothetical protein / location=Cvel_scaffold1631:30911-35886(+) / protein_length=922 / sequence_SO=supercontig / SO=protein_coding / is_pseudo=false